MLNLGGSTHAVIADANEDAAKELVELLDARKQDGMHDLFRGLVRQLPDHERDKFHPSDYEFYLSQNWLAGEEGDLHALVYDRKDGKLLWWHYFNF